MFGGERLCTDYGRKLQDTADAAFWEPMREDF